MVVLLVAVAQVNAGGTAAVADADIVTIGVQHRRTVAEPVTTGINPADIAGLTVVLEPPAILTGTAFEYPSRTIDVQERPDIDRVDAARAVAKPDVRRV